MWEWPGDRSPEARILVRIDTIAPARGGLSGSQQSPSIAGFLPDPMELAGSVMAGADPWVGSTVTLRLPRLELPEVGSGDLAGLGVIGGATCICIARAPDGLTGDAATAWLSAMPCGDQPG